MDEAHLIFLAVLRVPIRDEGEHFRVGLLLKKASFDAMHDARMVLAQKPDPLPDVRGRLCGLHLAKLML